MSDRSPFWFAAKTYGWGWGLPVRWQGWLVLSAYLALVYGGIIYFESRGNRASLGAYLVLLTVLLIVIVALKGERSLRWRWGKK